MSILISGVVSVKDKRPYLHMDYDGHLIQLSMAEARDHAKDILTACGYAEADAMILKFFDKQHFPDGAALALMKDFRDFRAALEDEEIEKIRVDPDTGEKS